MDLSTKIYVQAAPDERSRKQLESISDSLANQKSGRPVPSEELHITLIHFGKAEDILRAIREVVAISDQAYAVHLDDYVAATQALLNNQLYVMQPIGYARFGARHTTLVARFEAPAELVAVHSSAYRVLLEFLRACGVADSQDFAARNPNLQFAHTFNPHLTLYKGYDGENPGLPVPALTVSLMKLLY